MKRTARAVMFAIGLLAVSSLTSVVAQENQTILDKDIRVLDFADLEYPTLARTALVQGIVVVRAKLDDKGNVVDATALSGAGILIPGCLQNARKWRFRPNAKRTVVIVCNFRVTDALSKPACSHFVVEPPNFATITTCAPEIQ
jgi:hypothetical protein